MTGAVLGGYRITGILATGGMGQVFRAEHETLGKPAAVKVLRSQFTSDEDLVQRFFTEAKAATAIRHPGIIEIYDFGFTADGLAYLVMELLDGETLGARLRDRGKLSESEAMNFARGIATALVAAHAKGIVHRDLKPDNVFLVRDPDVATGERPKVLDFGIAKLLDAASNQTQTGALIGTPRYMAPEQARAARAIDHRADLYSLGCMLYEMIAGRAPFLAEGSGEVIAMHMFTEPELLSTHGPVTPDLEQIVMKLLAKEPDQRFQSAQQLVDALTALRGTGQVAPAFTSVAPILPTERILPPRDDRKRSMMPIIAGAITVALAAVGVTMLVTHSSTAATVAPVVIDAAPAAVPALVPPPSAKQKPHRDEIKAPVSSPSEIKKPIKRPPPPPAVIKHETTPGPALHPGDETKNHSPIEGSVDDKPVTKPE